MAGVGGGGVAAAPEICFRKNQFSLSFFLFLPRVGMLTKNNHPASPPNQLLGNRLPKRNTSRIAMDHHDLPPALIPPLVDTHSSIRSLDVSGSWVKVWWVGEGGDLGGGEVWEEGG